MTDDEITVLLSALYELIDERSNVELDDEDTARCVAKDIAIANKLIEEIGNGKLVRRIECQ